MPRKKGDGLFADDRPSDSPTPVVTPASDSAAPTTETEEPLTEPVEAPVKPPRKKKPKNDLDEDATLRERVRERAGKTQFTRIRYYESLLKDPKASETVRLEAAKRLDEMAIDKTPTAQPQLSNRKRILVGFAGALPGQYPGGSSILKESVVPNPQ